MSCPCASYTRIVVDLCAKPLVLAEVIADETGTWSAEIEFNGRPKCTVYMDVVDGQPVELPNVLNEVYTHEMRIFRSDGSLVGCYWIGGPSLRQEIICGGRIITENGNIILAENGNQLIPEDGLTITPQLANHVLTESGGNLISELNLQLVTE